MYLLPRPAQRTHTRSFWTGNSVQQTSQIGTEEICGRGEPQRVQEAGRRAQPRASMGLRSTRATARHREISDGGTSNVSEPESLRKTHLTWGSAANARCLATVYPDTYCDSMTFHPLISGNCRSSGRIYQEMTSSVVVPGKHIHFMDQLNMPFPA